MSTHNIPFSRQKKKITLNYPKSATVRICSTGLKNEFETAMVNEPSVFEPLKFYCKNIPKTILQTPPNLEALVYFFLFFLSYLRYCSSIVESWRSGQYYIAG